jgi:NADPH-dependent 2,4-dienoyl-CoA reductase/sulfur reductase-like enzyme
VLTRGGIVVVGAGLAGLRAAETLRERGFDGGLVVVGDETRQPYNRPPLSKSILLKGAGDTTFPIDETLDIEWKLGVSAKHLDVRNRTLVLSDGSSILYDGLIIATGSRAVRPSLPGADRADVHVLRTLDDALRLARALRSADSVAIIGAGLVGCEIASSSVELGKTVTLIDSEPMPMLRVLGRHVSHVIANMHRLNGVQLELSCTVSRIEKRLNAFEVALTNGKSIKSDVLVLATGGSPNTEWLDASTLTLDKGVRCDSRCFAIGGDGRIVAAGDVARWEHPDYDAPIRVEHWTNAGEQGVAAANALLDPDNALPFKPLLSFWTDQYGQRLQAIGAPWLGSEIVFTKGSPGDPKFVAISLRSGRITGAIVMNMPAGLLEWRTRIGANYA